eukprot:CAMPEP_0185768276 /NCGR_PEP_ID=MMETSP1174-20130828/48718_1 /TAXON_ID=35687 /ORGANISM="Dictyocha speculum, Strain CCMP1381" /LENGTH=298 /DNA_ID=CAMNT_0028452889 /DNA_START=12 /DNA_END=908 /DNA_ORIENTATION=+
MADEEIEVEECSDEEKLQIAQHFLLNAPPGQFNDVLNDVKKLLPPGLISDPMLAGICRAYNNKNNRVVSDGADVKVVLNEAAEIDPTHVVDQKSGQIVHVNHVDLTVGADGVRPTESTLPPGMDELRVAINTEVSDYIKSQYQAQTASCTVFAQDNDGEHQVYSVVISAEKLNVRNFWSGQWISTWTVTVMEQGTTVEGRIKVRAHYFEDGNVQLQTAKNTEPIKLSAETAGDELAKAVRKYILDQEFALQSGLEEMYTNMTEETFKAMRRVMPIHRNKVSWNLNEVKLTTNLTSKVK